MKDRIVKGWNIRRVIYLALGLAMLVHSVVVSQWIFAVFASYYVAMSIFNFGCASGNCQVQYKEKSQKPL